MSYALYQACTSRGLTTLSVYLIYYYMIVIICNAVVYYRLNPLALIGNEIATGDG